MPIPGGPELIILLVIVLIVFGAGKLPEVGGAIGRGIREFRAAQQDTTPEPQPPAAAPAARPEGTEAKS